MYWRIRERPQLECGQIQVEASSKLQSGRLLSAGGIAPVLTIKGAGRVG